MTSIQLACKTIATAVRKAGIAGLYVTMIVMMMCTMTTISLPPAMCCPSHTLALFLLFAFFPRDRYGLEGAVNVQGEDVKKLDIVANDNFINTLKV